MARSRARRKSTVNAPGSPGDREPEQRQENQPANGSEAAVRARSKTPQMDQRSRNIAFGLMGILLISFMVLAFLAPDPTRPNRSPEGDTVLWRLLFLLVPLAITYGLLWGDKILKLFKRG